MDELVLLPALPICRLAFQKLLRGPWTWAGGAIRPVSIQQRHSGSCELVCRAAQPATPVDAQPAF